MVDFVPHDDSVSVVLTDAERLQNDWCMHEFYDPLKCPKNNESLSDKECGIDRVIDWSERKAGIDVLECHKCGIQKENKTALDVKWKHENMALNINA